MRRGRLAYALSQLSDRERWLLGLMGFVALPLAVVFLAILPLTEARDRAQGEAREARALRDWVADQVRQMPADAGGASDAQAAAARSVMGLSGLEESLVSAGLRDFVRQLADRADGGVDLSFQSVPFARLSAWVSDTAPLWGYDLAAFRIDADTPGLVHADFELSAGEP